MRLKRLALAEFHLLVPWLLKRRNYITAEQICATSRGRTRGKFYAIIMVAIGREQPCTKVSDEIPLLSVVQNLSGGESQRNKVLSPAKSSHHMCIESTR